MNAPTLSPYVLLPVYCALILLASLAGGWIPLFVRLTHTRLQVVISFVAGFMLGIGVLHLLPHAWDQLQSIDVAAGWLMAGFLVMFFIQRFFHFHHHDVPENGVAEGHDASHGHETCDHEHGHDSHGHTLADQSASQLSWTGAALGLTLHTLIDGIALAASVQAESRAPGSGWLLGFGTFMVVLLHKPFDALAIGTLMAAGGHSKFFRHLMNGFFALAFPVGVLLFYLGVSWYSESSQQFLGIALAFTAGTFLCISTSDLLPELQFHAHDRLKLSFALLLGLGLSAIIGKFETAGHNHHHDAPASLRESPAHR